MAHNRKRKTEREPVDSVRMKTAVEEVVNGQKSAASIAAQFGIKRTTLRRYIQKYTAAGEKEEVAFMPQYNARQVFTADQERLLAVYSEEYSFRVQGNRHLAIK
jgi:transposase-like protein